MGFTEVPIVQLCCLIIFMSSSMMTVRAHSAAQNFLSAFNPVRAELGLPPLEWDNELALYAKLYALKRSVDCAMIHSNGPYGENIAWAGWNMKAREAVDLWSGEKKDYDYQSNTCADGKMCGHYTQIVWRNSTKVGCAKSFCKSGGGTFVTCNFNPPGNYIGERPY